MKPLRDELRRAAYDTCEEASSACNVFENLIANQEGNVILLREFMDLADVECSEEFANYGWGTDELSTAIIEGDIYAYTGSSDYKWHINVPDPHILGG